MPRKRRVWMKGGYYHVFSRGNQRRKLFYDQKDYKYFLYYLECCMSKYDFKVHSYCLMPNHFHMLIEMGEQPLSDAFMWLNRAYAKYYNERYEKTGHVFERRFEALPIISVKYLLCVSKYIHRNPVAANIVGKAEDYPWSSFRTFIIGKSDSLTTCDKILSYFDNKRVEYYRYVESSYLENEEEQLTEELELNNKILTLDVSNAM